MRKSQVPAPKSLSGMKRIEESFVPSLNNVTSVIQLKWFRFVFKG